MKKKILFVTTEYPPGPGGIGEQCYQLTRYFKQQGYDVRVLANQTDATEQEIQAFNSSQEFVIENFNQNRSSYKRVISRMLNKIQVYNQMLLSFKPNLIIASGSVSILLTAFISVFKKNKWFAIGHGGEFGVKNILLKKALQAAFSRADQVICVSRFTQGYMKDKGFHPKHSTVIHNGADESIVRNVGAVPKELSAIMENPGTKTIVTVGTVHERKGHEVIIRALPKIVAEGIDAHYIAVGDPRLQNQLEEVARKLDVSDRVHFTGKKTAEERNAILSQCDLYALVSIHSREGDFEGFGISVLEAALFGKPSIVSEGSGLSEAVIHDQTGIAVPANDPEETANKIIELFKDKNRSILLGNAAKKRALKNFTHIHMGASYAREVSNMIGCSNEI